MKPATLTGAEPSYFAIAENVGLPCTVNRAKAASNAWDDMAAHALHGGPEYDAAKARFWKLNAADLRHEFHQEDAA